MAGSQIFQRAVLQGITDGEITILLNDLEKMVPQHSQTGVHWDQTGKEQGTRPRKLMVSMWFKHEVNLNVIKRFAQK